MSMSPPAGATGLENVSVLIVDDSRVMRELLTVILRGCGVGRICEAGDGEAGLEAIRDLKPDIVFADWMMQPMDGHEFVRKVRQDPDSPNPLLPIIMITGHSEAKRVRAARDAGATEFLAKPVTAKAVARRLEAIIHLPRPFVRTSQFFGPDRRRKVASFDGMDKRGRGGERASIIGAEEIQHLLEVEKSE